MELNEVHHFVIILKFVDFCDSDLYIELSPTHQAKLSAFLTLISRGTQLSKHFSDTRH